MVVIIAVVAYLGTSALVIWGSLYVNRNVCNVDQAARLKIPDLNIANVVLKPTPVNFRFSRLARGFLSLRERYDTAWEIGEGVMVAAVFGLLFLGYEEQERAFGLISHALVGVLLVAKFVSLGGAWWGRRYSPGQNLY
jgi:hypothetical protein